MGEEVMSEENPGLLEARGRRGAQAAVVVGAAAFAFCLKSEPARAWGNLLIGNFYFIGTALCGLVFIAVQYVAKGGWATVFRRVPEAVSGYLPIGLILTCVTFFGIHDLYHWSHHEAVAADAILQAKAAYLNSGGYMLRAILYFAVWLSGGWLLLRQSRAQDQDGNVERTQTSLNLSAVFLILFGITFTLASVDWLMSLEPHWYSTMFPWYTFSGIFVHGIAVITLLIILLRRHAQFADVSREHLHDLGKYIFAFSVFWGYLWFSQYLLIWYSHIPEETVHYAARGLPGWSGVFWLNPIINLVAPMALLLSIRSKRSPGRLGAACGVLLLGHWIDLYQIVMPSLQPQGATLGLPELFIFLGVGGLFLLAFDRSFRRYLPVPKNDPYLVESTHHHVT
jgi:hypothetical protein